MSRETRLALGWTIAFTLAGWGWLGLTRDVGALALAAVTAAAVFGLGAVARWLRLGEAWVSTVQVCAIATVAAIHTLGTLGPDGLPRLGPLLQRALASVQGGPPPIEPQAGVTLGLIVLAGALALVADVFAVTMGRVAWSVLVLLGLLVPPAVLIGTPLPLADFVRFGVAVVIVLLVGADDVPGRRPLAARAAGWGGVVTITTLALVIAWVVSQVAPFQAARPLGNDPIQMSDPSLDLKRNLTQGEPTPILTYTTDQATGSYLKLATLTSFDTSGFALDDVSVSQGRLPSPPGLTGPGTPRRTDVTVGDFASEWLPIPYAPTEVSAPGPWGHITDTLDVLALNVPTRKSATQGIRYTVRSVDVRPDATQLAAATASTTPNRAQFTQVPEDLPARVRTLAGEVTGAAPTAGAKALAVQAYLQSERFRYSTAPAPGDSMASLTDFLFGSRRGYCEQYAGAMVALLRSVDVPARIAVGFTPGRQVDGVWQVTSRDMHAWPEVWLDGWGWVAFEPTPGSGVPTTAGATEPSTAPTPGASATVTQTPSAEPEASASPTPEAEPGEESNEAETAWPWWGPLGALLALGGVLAVPRLLRDRARARRLGTAGDARATTVAAWAELRATASDVGVAWPGGSPRYVARALSESVPADLRPGLLALGLATERALFDEPDADVQPGRAEAVVRGVTQAWLAQATTAARVRATWWPRSVWERAGG